ncbi:MAG: glycoside hydrolase family 16 protein [Saprospiraceae bacterium]|nr:glycoside hydrolase family 16 protein [Saprospiraceae bacterium]
MKNNVIFLFLMLFSSASGCKTEQVLPTQTAPKTIDFVDAQTPKDAAPYLLGDSLMQTKKNWELVFSDEFNDNQLNPSKWTIETSSRVREDITVYSSNAQVAEKDGKAYLYYEKTTQHDSAYSAGRINSKNKFSTTYGYLECRIHLVKPDGYQTAFWMMPVADGPMSNAGTKDGTANDGAEIDIVEGNKLTTYSNGLHWDGYAAPYHKSNGTNIKTPDLHTVEYHIFGFEWTPNFLKFYYDGNLVRTMSTSNLIPHTPHYILFTGSCWGVNDWVVGDVRKNQLLKSGKRDEAYIDYMRVYKSK